MTAPAQAPSVQPRPSKEPPANGPGTGRPATPARQGEVCLGVAGDELTAASLHIPVSGVVAVLGNPGSGKSNTLRALEALNPGQQWCRCQGPLRAADDFWADMLVQAESGSLPRETMLLVDDADHLAPSALRGLGQLNALGYSLVVTAGYSPALLQRAPLFMNARASGAGILLGPRSMADGDLFGVRFETESNPPPGRGALISAGGSVPLQVAWAGAEG